MDSEKHLVSFKGTGNVGTDQVRTAWDVAWGAWSMDSNFINQELDALAGGS